MKTYIAISSNTDYYQLGYDSYLNDGYERRMSEIEWYHSNTQQQDAFFKGQKDAQTAEIQRSISLYKSSANK